MRRNFGPAPSPARSYDHTRTHTYGRAINQKCRLNNTLFVVMRAPCPKQITPISLAAAQRVAAAAAAARAYCSGLSARVHATSYSGLMPSTLTPRLIRHSKQMLRAHAELAPILRAQTHTHALGPTCTPKVCWAACHSYDVGDSPKLYVVDV